MNMDVKPSSTERLRLMRWRPIDTAPKDGTDILIFAWGNSQIVVSYDESNAMHPWRTLDGIGYHKDSPTHWMPLPEPPK